MVDVRWSPSDGIAATRRAFEEGHVPTAAFLDLDRDLAARAFVEGPGRHPLPTPERFAETMGSIGIGDDTVVVAYDDVRGSVAARLWWMLEIIGRRAALLDGGLDAWRAAGGHIERGPAVSRRGSFTPTPWPKDRIVDAGVVASTIRSGVSPVLDARATERYRGDTEPFDPVAGHVPGARSAPWTANLDAQGRFLPPTTLRHRYEAMGVTDAATIAYCGSGVTSCVDLLALRLAGFGDARLYEGSWSDWVGDPGRLVATGDEAGTLD